MKFRVSYSCRSHTSLVNKNKYKFVLQKEDFDCGVAAVATTLLNTGTKSVSYGRLSKVLNLSKKGVLSDDISAYFLKKKKLEPKLTVDAGLADLKREIDKGRVCLVMYQGWAKEREIVNLEWGHYALAVAYEAGKIYLLDPSVYEDWGDGLGWRIIRDKKFAKRWVEKEGRKTIRGWMLSLKPR